MTPCDLAYELTTTKAQPNLQTYPDNVPVGHSGDESFLYQANTQTITFHHQKTFHESVLIIPTVVQPWEKRQCCETLVAVEHLCSDA